MVTAVRSKVARKETSPFCALRERAPDDSNDWMVVEREASLEE